MEGLLESINKKIDFSTEEIITDEDHPRISLFKLKNPKDQHERRIKYLEWQKGRRSNVLCQARGLCLGEWDSENDEESFNSESMDVSSNCNSRKLTKRTYNDQLMLSEWLVDIPADMSSEYLVVPSPVGRRSLVVTGWGRTTSYSKSGFRHATFNSLLPGGSKKTRSGFTILDAIYCEEGDPVTQLSPFNLRRFVCLPAQPATFENLIQILSENGKFTLDGLLFYHKEVHYTAGTTPLVTWLKPWMAKDILGIHLTSELIEKFPIPNNCNVFEPMT